MKKVIILLLMIFSVVMIGSAQEQDTDFLDLPILEDGDLVLDEFGDGVYAHLYAFVSTEGDSVTVTMTPTEDSEVDPYLILMGEAGQVYFANDDAEAGDVSSLIESFELPVSGTYYLLATTWDTRVNQSFAEEAESDDLNLEYELFIEGINPPEDSEEALTMFRGEVEIGMGGVIEITEDQPVFYLTFEASEGEVVTISALSDDIDTLLYLFNPSGQRIAINDDREPGDFSALIDEFEIPDDGTYIVFVTAFNFYDGYQDNLVTTGAIDFSID